MRFSEAIKWCQEHNARVDFTRELTVTISIDAFEGFVEGYSFCGAVEAAHKRLVDIELEDSEVITSELTVSDTPFEGE